MEADIEAGDLEVAVRHSAKGFASTTAGAADIAAMKALCSASAIELHPGGGVEVWMRVPLEADERPPA